MLQYCKDLAERGADRRARKWGACNEWERLEEQAVEERKTPIFLQSAGPGKEGAGWGEETSQHSHKKMGYLLRSEQASLLVKEDLTAIQVLLPLFPSCQD